MESNPVCLEITTPIQISKNGQLESASSVELFAPSAKNLKDVSKLKSLTLSLVQKISKGNSDPAIETEQKETLNNDDFQNQINGAEVIGAFYVFGEEDGAYKAIELVKSLIVNGGAKIEGLPFTSSIIDKLSLKDIEIISGTYISSFLLQL